MSALLEAAFGRPQEAALVSTLRTEAVPYLSLVAVREREILGHIFFSPVQLGLRVGTAHPAGGLAPLAVAPPAQGQGVGSTLVRAGLTAAATLGWRAVFVLGEPAYYRRFGFSLAARRGLRYESSAFDAAFQCLELSAGALAGCEGQVRYHDAFARL